MCQHTGFRGSQTEHHLKKKSLILGSDDVQVDQDCVVKWMTCELLQVDEL